MDVGLVCDTCSTFSEMGSQACQSCSAPLSFDGAKELETQGCTNCGATLMAGNRFCGSCGTPVGKEAAPAPAAPSPPSVPQVSNQGGGSKQTLFFSNMQAAKAKLVLIKGEGYDGESYTLAGNEHFVGRSEGDILFDEDPFLSPTHANFLYVAGKLIVKDESGGNGVFLRIRGSHPIDFEDCFLVGEQIMQVHKLPPPGPPSADGDGTYLYSSPRRDGDFKLSQILQGGARGLDYPATNNSASLGREGNDINFPDDPFISGHHAQVSFDGNQLSLSDMGSKNGTFVRVNGQTQLEHGDYVFMGQQLLRVEIV